MFPSPHLRIAALLGASGGTVMFAINLTASAVAGPDDWLRLSAMAALGAFAGGLPAAALFGRAGRAGAALALVGAVGATTLGSGLGAALALWPGESLAGLILGPVFVAASIATSPPVGAAWALSMIGVQIDARRARGRIGGQITTLRSRADEP